MENMSEILTVENLSKRFRIRYNRPSSLKESIIQRLRNHYDTGRVLWALRNVNFSVQKGSSLGIIGHNGAGKSTLLRLLCGLGRPTTGKIWRLGQVGSLLELGSGFHSDMTGRENLMTGGILSGLRKQEVVAIQDEIIAFAELENFIDQPVRTYSSGMYVRLAFSSAIHLDPEILVVDELLAVGDSRFQKKCIDRLKDFHKDGKTLILTSHDLDQIRPLCNDVLVLEEGRVIMQGEPETAINCYHDLMRQRTEERAARVSGQAPSEIQTGRGSRLGTMEASIEKVRIKDASDKEVESVQSGDGLAVELEYQRAPSVSDMILLLGIYTETNLKCFETVIQSVLETFGNLSGEGMLCCRLSDLPLLPGRYYLNLGLYPTDWNYTYDYHWQMHALQIEGKESSLFHNISGIVAIKPTWTISEIDLNP